MARGRETETVRDLEKIQDYLKEENATLSNKDGRYISKISEGTGIERKRIWELGPILVKEGKLYRQLKLKAKGCDTSWAVKDQDEIAHGGCLHTKYYINDMELPPQKEVDEKLGYTTSYEMDNFFEFLRSKMEEITNRLADERGTLGPGGTKNWQEYIEKQLVQEIKNM
ncbi:MAG: hypothetical protein JSV92_00580 [archaeon]|nr:MAG: hypothetical protein JSV92_00580 [archaeon]